MKINRKKYIYTGGIILLIIIITTRYLDTLYYFNKANIRYAIGVYFKSGYYKGIIHQFKYRVADFDYIVDTRYGLHNKELNKLRIIVKYSEKWSEHSEIVMDTVPKWVLSPPKDGWKQFPPDINWKGAELDTAYMKKMGIAIPE